MKRAMAFAFVVAFTVSMGTGWMGSQASAKPGHDHEQAAKPVAAAAKGKEVTLKGTMLCSKCMLKEAKECQNVLKVTEGGKEVKYYLAQNEVAKANHEAVCSDSKPATVKGTVSEAGGKKTITASEIKFAS